MVTNKYEKLVKESCGKRISRSKAIRYKCLDCCNYQGNEVKDCPSKSCPLWRYRMGHEERDELYDLAKNKEKQEDMENELEDD